MRTAFNSGRNSSKSTADRTSLTLGGSVSKPAKLQKYLKHGHKTVEGWLLPGAIKIVIEIARVQRDNNIAGNIAEVGIHHGKSLILLYLLSRNPERVVAVDLFGEQQKNIDNSGEGNLSKFLSNVKRHADDLRLVIYEGDSTAIDSCDLIGMAEGRCRLISVDGGHTPGITQHDLATAEGALCEGGVIILDDCFNEMWPGVSDGVHRYFAQTRNIAPFAIGSNKTLFCHPHYAWHYVDALRKVAVKSVEREFLGYPVLCCDFAPLPVTEKIGRQRWWQSVKELGPIRSARSIYRMVRTASTSIR
jgi:hypothetical protein